MARTKLVVSSQIPSRSPAVPDAATMRRYPPPGGRGRRWACPLACCRHPGGIPSARRCRRRAVAPDAERLARRREVKFFQIAPSACSRSRSSRAKSTSQRTLGPASRSVSFATVSARLLNQAGKDQIWISPAQDHLVPGLDEDNHRVRLRSGCGFRTSYHFLYRWRDVWHQSSDRV